MSDKFESYIVSQLEELNQKVDRLQSLLMQFSTTHQTNLGDWLTEEQTKELLHLGSTSLWTLRKSEKIKYSKLGGRIYYSRKSILDSLKKSESK